ncbi:hypothetical protein MN608_07691 [Microdochium nivale]|nr:hypothetical protein MN608_07691 [Microdochium nivale]
MAPHNSEIPIVPKKREGLLAKMKRLRDENGGVFKHRDRQKERIRQISERVATNAHNHALALQAQKDASGSDNEPALDEERNIDSGGVVAGPSRTTDSASEIVKRKRPIHDVFDNHSPSRVMAAPHPERPVMVKEGNKVSVHMDNMFWVSWEVTTKPSPHHSDDSVGTVSDCNGTDQTVQDEVV